MKHFFLILMMIFPVICFSQTKKAVLHISAQANFDQTSLRSALETLKRETNVPIKLIEFLPAADKDDLLYTVIRSASRDRYELSFNFTPDCSLIICHKAYISGEKITTQTPAPKGKKVVIKGTLTGFYEESSCGGSCIDDALTWDENGFRYTVGSYVGKLETSRMMANSIKRTINDGILDKVFPDIKAFQKVYMKDKDVLELEAAGDLNSDGLADWAGLIQRTKKLDLEDDDQFPVETIQLYILLQQKRGGYRIGEKSVEADFGGLGGTLLEALKIKNSSLYLQINSKGADWIKPVFYQFKLYRGEWRLIGLRTFNLEISKDFSIETDMNLLTGDVVEERQKGDRKPVNKRRKKNFAKLLLKDFEFSYNAAIKK